MVNVRINRLFVFAAAALASGVGLSCGLPGSADPPSSAVATTQLAAGTFEPSWQSLSQYKTPEWFRDAKFGIWAHWTAQCVPEQGDWYAQQMYIQGNPDYNYQVAHYGHPSKVGFKDIDHIWHAEHWEPEKLIELYKRAGARYFVALANHHDNFDMWNSKYQPWNAVNIGPKKDIIGTWAKAARKNGLRFGVTVHAARTWDWFEAAQGSDKTGPLAGVPYDGKLTKADGKGLWWEGYDPQDLYAQNHAIGAPPDQAYIDKFFLRTKDLIDQYHPDLLYFDDGVLPLNNVSDAGLRIAAHLYNQSESLHGGRNEAVMNTKGLNEEQRKCLVWDIERGESDLIQPLAWQTDTCIGDWHYRRSIYDTHSYKTADSVVKTLIDIVSKNGNLLLNIPLPGDGRPDPDEIKFLEDMAAWMNVNSDAIYGTRPWSVYGEGPAMPRHATGGGNFNEGRNRPFTSQDFRFTTKAGSLYAVALAWPDSGEFTVHSLATPAGKVTAVSLLGYKQKLDWRQTADGLVVHVPAAKPCEHAYTLKIAGQNLKPVPPPEIDTTINAGAGGSFHLGADTADMHGSQIRVEESGNQANIGYWDNPGDWAFWTIRIPAPGRYHITMEYSAANGDTPFDIHAAGAIFSNTAAQTAGWTDYKTANVGIVEINAAGKQEVSVRAHDRSTWKAMNVRSITLTKLP